MRSLILGGNGFIGSHLIDKLLAEGHEVSVLDKYPERYRKPLKGVEYLYGEFGNRGLLAEALNNKDIVFHLVSTTLPKTSNDDPVFDVQSNLIESLFLLEQCVFRKIKKVVFTSSGGAVYGTAASLPINEFSNTDPDCSYGITKLSIEKYLSLYKKLHGLDYTILRLSNPYGSRQNPGGIQGAVSVFLGKAAQNQAIEIWGDGSVVRDYIYIKDLVEGIYQAAVKDTESKIFNIGSGIGVSLNEILGHVKRVTNRDLKVNYTPKRIFDVPAIYLDISLAKRQLEWSPATSLEEGISLTWDFVQPLFHEKV